MPKLSLERFREIKERIAEIFDLVNRSENEKIEIPDEEKEKIESDLEQIMSEIHSSDLSDIAFEEYEGFYDIGFDFSGTGANIDFNIISELGIDTVRLKGCNVRNFDFENQRYDEKSFDENFMSQHPDKFIDSKLPEEVKKRYYIKNLNISDIIKYNLYNEIENGRISRDTVSFFKKVKPDIAKSINPDIFDISDLSYYIRNSLKNYEGEITEETLKAIIAEDIEKAISSSYLKVDAYKKIINIQNIAELIPGENIIDFKEDDNLASRFLEKKLTLKDIYENAELFKEKKFLSKFTDYQYYPRLFENITEEKIYYLFENFPDIAEGLADEQKIAFDIVEDIDIEIPKEENLKNIQKQVAEIVNSDSVNPDIKKKLERYYSLEVVQSRLSDNERAKLETIMEYTTPEKIESYGISPRLLEDYSIRSLFYAYGLETVMEFDKANGNVFSRNNFELARMMSDYYIHYAGNRDTPDKILYYRQEDPDDWYAPYSKDDFEENVRRMIVYGPTNNRYSSIQPINFGNFSQEFRNKFPRMFLPQEAPQELKNKFYTKKIDSVDLEKHPEWINYLEKIDYELGIQIEYTYFRNTDKSNEASSFLESLKQMGDSGSEILEFIKDNAKTIKVAEIYHSRNLEGFYNSFEATKSLDDIRVMLENKVENKILIGAVEYGEPYIPEFFKAKHPELILDENAPEELKAKFYSMYIENGKEDNIAESKYFTLEDLANKEYKKYLVGKSFSLLRNADTVKMVTEVLDPETISDLYNIDPSAFEMYCGNAERINALKTAIDNYPQLYAKEELMQGLRISEDEFKIRLQDEEFKKKFEFLKREYVEKIVSSPGFMICIEPENYSREMLRQYNELTASNMLQSSNSFARESYEQIIGHMLGFLGYEEAKKMLEVPKIDEETMNRIYEHDEAIKSLYEKKFEIIGNLKVISKLLEGFPTLMEPAEKITSKTTCKLFMSLNKRIQNGYNQDITTLINEILAENNIEINNDKINQLTERVIAISTAQKLDLVRESNSVLIDTSINENQKTKNMIKMHYKNALEYSLKKVERVDPNLVQEYLEKEFGRMREDGQPYYSPHVTGHLEELISFANELTSNPESSLKLNHSITDDLRIEAEKIGKGWIRKITSNLCYRAEKLTYEETEMLDSMIYPKESELEIDTKATIGLRELNEEERAKVYELLANEEYRGLFTYGKAENMFSAMKLPYSEKFKDYFLKYKDEFISDYNLYTKFTNIAVKFDSYLEEPGFNTRYMEGTLIPNDILLKLSKDVYPNLFIGKGEHEVIYQARDAGLTEEQAKIALELFKSMRKREYQTVPQEQFETKRFRGRIVRIDDPLHLSIGEITNCCQTIGIGQPGESSMVHSATERNGALFVVEELDELGKSNGIMAQSWTWRNGNRVCFDNVEVPHAVEDLLKQVGGFDEIMEVYQESAKRMIETDRIKLKKLLESGKITQNQYQSMVIKDVGMGLRCDDLVRNLSFDKKLSIPKLVTVTPLEKGKIYTGAESKMLYSDSESNAVLIAHNDDFAPTDHTHTNNDVGEYGVQYTKPRDIFRRKGSNIDGDKISAISAMVKKAGRVESSFASNPVNISEVAYHFGINDPGLTDLDRIKVSMSDTGDWYILSEETPKGVMVLESGFDTTNPETEFEKKDRKLAFSEYTREIHKMILESSMKGKAMTIDSYSIEKFINLEPLIREETISLENGVIVVKNTERLTEITDDYDKTIDQQRRERLTISNKEEFDR